MEIDKNKIKAVLFDLDGTLFRSEACDYVAWDAALKRFGINVTPDLYPIYTGKSAEWVEADLIRRFGLDIPEGLIVKTKKEIFLEMFGTEEISLMPYAKEVVHFLKEEGKALALCTGGVKQEVCIKLKSGDMLPYFPVIVTADDVISNKPAPDVYLSAMERLGVEPSECLAVEDTETGMMAAKNAGAYCFVVPNDFSRKQDFSRADKELSSLQELIVFFGGIK
jgi:HAD superfamily hydrolase (TIGR01509 family)